MKNQTNKKTMLLCSLITGLNIGGIACAQNINPEKPIVNISKITLTTLKNDNTFLVQNPTTATNPEKTIISFPKMDLTSLTKILKNNNEKNYALIEPKKSQDFNIYNKI